MSAAFVAGAVIGFLPTYWIPLFSGSLAVPPITHVHALPDSRRVKLVST
jgi:hypothetical protein